MTRLHHNPAFGALRCALLASAFSLSAACSQSPRGDPPRKAGPAVLAALPAAFRNGLVFVKVAINSGPDAWMDLDTGTSPSIVVPAYARSAGLTLTAKGKATEGFGSQKIETFTTSTAVLRVGHERPRAVKFESIELSGMKGPEAQPLSGLLGQSFLAGKIVVFDYQNQKLFFRGTPEANSGIDVPMILVGGVPLVRIALDGHEVLALVDTGGTYGLLVTPKALKQTGLQRYLKLSRKVRTVGHGGEQAATVDKAPTLTLAGMVIPGLSAVYTSLGTTTIPAVASLGKDFLKHYRVTLNYAAGTARFEPNELRK